MSMVEAGKTSKLVVFFKIMMVICSLTIIYIAISFVGSCRDTGGGSFVVIPLLVVLAASNMFSCFPHLLSRSQIIVATIISVLCAMIVVFFMGIGGVIDYITQGLLVSLIIGIAASLVAIVSAIGPFYIRKGVVRRRRAK